MSGDEAWAPIPRHPGYEASTLGRVRSIDRIVATKAGVRRRYRGIVLRPKVGRKGYLMVHLSGGPMRTVHQVVLEAFVGPRPDGLVCRHKDDNPANNALGNLHWGTPSENTQDSVAAGHHAQLAKIACPFDHPLTEPNLTGSSARRGVRGCLACNRANAMFHRLTRKGIEVDIKDLADKYYREIMEVAAA